MYPTRPQRSGAGRSSEQDLRRRLASQPALSGMAVDEVEQAARGLARISEYVHRLSQSQQRELARLAHDAPGIDITPVPLLGQGVSNLDSLRSVADQYTDLGQIMHLVGA